MIAETDQNDASVVTLLGMDAVWADDFHHQVRVTLTGERDGYYGAFVPGAAGVAEAIERGWLRGQPAVELEAERFVYCIQNHDQIGNRAFGERLSGHVTLDAYAAVSTLLLLLPMTPLMFMGQEWAASSPFLYFTDHEPELGELVRRGRRAEFKEFSAFTDPESREKIPHPQSDETFERSRLTWGERSLPAHHRILELYRELLSLRRTDPVLRSAERSNLRVEARFGVLMVYLEVESDIRLLLVNFGELAVSLTELGVSESRWRRLLSTSTAAEGLAAESALLLASTEA